MNVFKICSPHYHRGKRKLPLFSAYIYIYITLSHLCIKNVSHNVCYSWHFATFRKSSASFAKQFRIDSYRLKQNSAYIVFELNLNYWASGRNCGAWFRIGNALKTKKEKNRCLHWFRLVIRQSILSLASMKSTEENRFGQAQSSI